MNVDDASPERDIRRHTLRMTDLHKAVKGHKVISTVRQAAYLTPNAQPRT